MEECEEEDNDGVVPSCPVAVGELKGVRDLRLGGVVRGLEGGARVIVASRVCKG